MAPFSLLSAGVSSLAKSFGLFSNVSNLARCTSAFPAIKSFSTTPAGPPKRPLNGYMRYVMQQRPLVIKQTGINNTVDIIKKIAYQWKMLSPEQKRPFQDASVLARQQFKMELQRYQAQLSPAQVAKQAEEKREKRAKRKSIKKKRELTSLGKPKRPRSGFNIYLSEHFEEAKAPTMAASLKKARDNWDKLYGYQKNVYIQLAEDDKVRYKNEMLTWESHMVDIGRQDLVRGQTKKRGKPVSAKKTVASKAKKPAVKAKTAAKASIGKATLTKASVRVKPSAQKTIGRTTK